MTPALQHRPQRLVWVGMIGLSVLVVGAGCASTSGRMQYTSHVSHRIDAGCSANTDIAFAFGLDGLGDRGSAIVRAPDE